MTKTEEAARAMVEAVNRLNLGQYGKMKFTAPNCKCGKCQLVPLDVVLEADSLLRALIAQHVVDAALKEPGR